MGEAESPAAHTFQQGDSGDDGLAPLPLAHIHVVVRHEARAQHAVLEFDQRV